MENAGKDTRQRLLEAACAIFAGKGYTGTTFADICEQADANIALVNYYFGDKAALYNCVWRYAFDMAANEFPIDGGVDSAATAEQRLRAAIRAILGRIFADSDSAYFPRLMVQEMASPSAALVQIAEEAIGPQMQYVAGIMRELLGPKAADREVFDCMTSTMSQCFMLSCSQPVLARIFCEEDPASRDLEAMTDHIVSYSLGGIREIRKNLEKR